MEAHRTRVPYRIGAEELERVCRSTDHALGAVRRVDAEGVVSIVDWEPNYAVAHVLHYALERCGAPFTWQWFRMFCRDDLEARRMLYEPAQEMVRRAVSESSSGLTPAGARAAMRWRVGNFYYSFLRELYLVVRLREHGLDVRMHPLADALYRVDAWWGDVAFAIYIRNGRFRDGVEGRKPTTDSITGWAVCPIRLPVPSRFGVVNLPAVEDIDRIARALRSGELPRGSVPRQRGSVGDRDGAVQ